MCPRRLQRAFRGKDFGSYAHDSGEDVPLCFLSNADTTGGNSGSPVLDGEGRLIGLNFDRVYENIAGDYGYNLQRSRNVMGEHTSDSLVPRACGWGWPCGEGDEG